MKLKYRHIMIGLWVLSSICLAATNDSGTRIAWGYKGDIGPEFWGQLNPEFALCSQGKAQSPINITKPTITTHSELTIQYAPAPLTVMRNGDTKLVIGKKPILYNDGHGLQVDFHKPEPLIYEHNKYQLIEFHFHSPSETEWQGRSFPLEIHFVHQGKEGRVAVVAVFVEAGAENATLTKLIEHLPEADGKEYDVKDNTINPEDLLPSERNYFSFVGSLTTPPCTEGLQWIVFPKPITASPAQIASIRQAIGGSNARAVQPLNQRVITYSKQD